MKKTAGLICLIWAMAFILCGCQRHPDALKTPGTPAPAVPDAPLVYLSFSESGSYFKRVQGYEFRAQEDGSKAFFWMANEEEPYPVAVDEAWVATLNDFIVQYDMMNWDGFSGSAPGLLDGTSFGFELTLADGTAVHAGGYGDFPDGYREASEAIDVHFMQLLPQDMRDW